MEATTKTTPIFAMMSLCVIILVFGGLIHSSMVPDKYYGTEEAFLFALPTFFVVGGSLVFALLKNTETAIAALISAVSILGITCLLFGAKIMMPLAFTFGFIVILLFHFGVNPICAREFKKWLGNVAEEEK